MPYHELLAATLSFVVAVILTGVVRSLARRWGIVARPRADRWHKEPTALLGGVAIFVSVVVIHFAFQSPTCNELPIWTSSAVLFAVGLADDLWRLRPYHKMLGQIVGAGLVLGAGWVYPWTGLALVDRVVTLFWLIGITNALNLIDNMDGLAAGIAAIAATFFTIHFWQGDQSTDACLFAILAGALLGFLVYNFNPASVFMGDCGALFIGIFLAIGPLRSEPATLSSNMVARFAWPILTLAVPILDTTLVTVVRTMTGRRVTQGGRDHTSHRLVARGLSERWAVAVLYGLAGAAGFVAWLVNRVPAELGLILVAGCAGSLALFGIYLARVNVYNGESRQ
jgi:UDP-GlcNAc:undecaprenyl-phosphate GlcNAc-1-phosphate transferase